MEKVLHLLCHLHSLHRQGPDQHEALGAAIGQAYKACEQRQRDGDWTLGWIWTGVPDPRPTGPYARSLAHPSEHAAGLAYLRELHALAAHRDSVASGQRPAHYQRTGGGGQRSHQESAAGADEGATEGAGAARRRSRGSGAKGRGGKGGAPPGAAGT